MRLVESGEAEAESSIDIRLKFGYIFTHRMASSNPHTTIELKRELTSFDMSMIAVGAMIGSGIFATPSIIAAALPTPLWILGAWTLGGIATLAGALTFAELGTMMPRAGGVYVFLSEAYGSLTGFLYGWAYLVIANTGSIAGISIVFATYFGHFVPLTPWEINLVAIAGIVIVTTVNVLGVKAGGIFSDVFTVLKLCGILALITVGLTYGSSGTTDFTGTYSRPAHSIWSGLAIAMAGVLWSFGGFQHVTFTAAEAKNPQRSIPRGIILGTVAVLLIYLLTNVAYMFLLTPTEMAAAPRVASTAIGQIFGPVGEHFIAIAIFVSTFGTAGIYTLTAPRIYYAMARDRIFFKGIARVHPRYRTPAPAIILQSAWAIVLILLWGTFENLISYVEVTEWIFFGLAGSTIFVYRKRAPHQERPYRVPGYPITPLIFIGVAAWFVVTIIMEKPLQTLTGIGFLLLGVPVYYIWRRRWQREGEEATGLTSGDSTR